MADLSPGELTSGGVLLAALGVLGKMKWDQSRTPTNGKSRLSKADYDAGVKDITDALADHAKAMQQAVRDINYDHREVMNTYLAETKVAIMESEGRLRGSRS